MIGAGMPPNFSTGAVTHYWVMRIKTSSKQWHALPPGYHDVVEVNTEIEFNRRAQCKLVVSHARLSFGLRSIMMFVVFDTWWFVITFGIHSEFDTRIYVWWKSIVVLQFFFINCVIFILIILEFKRIYWWLNAFI